MLKGTIKLSITAQKKNIFFPTEAQGTLDTIIKFEDSENHWDEKANDYSADENYVLERRSGAFIGTSGSVERIGYETLWNFWNYYIVKETSELKEMKPWNDPRTYLSFKTG